MPTATLNFNLPEERLEYEHANNGEKYLGILQDYDQWLHGIVKYGPGEAEKKLDVDTIQVARDKLWEFLKEENLDINDG